MAVPSTFGTAKIVSSVTEINPVKAIVERAADCFLLPFTNLLSLQAHWSAGKIMYQYLYGVTIIQLD